LADRLSDSYRLLVNFGHTLSVGLLVRPWPYRPYRRRRTCSVPTKTNSWLRHCLDLGL